ncbi:MAG: Arc family DNA-binding protein [Rhodospirillales bacterium]|jgi:plasmid stability protein|nr:hypothetical protein [Rhodospirillaceae bacterium]MDP6430224.1 Arc family DNA-binding protein [Rhodospirillales bacterium]MDP6646213.1 Arc family DNA-binding protein [Rhodospirillales bacterium]MDP6840131.1 Arc family DNA-binding protein [Rhodospirillales bacterium]|tara:strand:+ start:2636 stop:2872 length:237 start_codon:yes stop_codon:yes gene_type:complete
MPVNFSVKNVPDEIAEKLRMRAKRHHRSLQGELLTILEEAAARAPIKTAADVLREVRKDGLSTPSEAADIIGADRDSH